MSGNGGRPAIAKPEDRKKIHFPSEIFGNFRIIKTCPSIPGKMP